MSLADSQLVACQHPGRGEQLQDGREQDQAVAVAFRVPPVRAAVRVDGLPMSL
ncbi:MAG TPA: hypothetical protein VIJ82_25555 [Streptosporangiaceae bacterium]